ncbi:tripartite tricarboxylate transporter substrate binding protein [Pigmentiphaga soli]|uniref:Tripartite tricarboxylate transporter substrate binding protein n=1 Tax=Pigmentiphaga soli TaxID=1007095 RepID=A0ABP8GC19_9BURK
MLPELPASPGSPVHGPAQPGRRRALQAALLGAGLGSLALSARAADYPRHPVTIISAHAAGGGADSLSRILAAALSNELGQTFIVENRPGASTMLAAEYTARAAPDGYSLLMATVTTLSINPSLYKKLRYDPVRDFAPVSMIATTPFFVGVTPELPAQSASDLLRMARAQPGKLNYGSSGNGTSSHLAGELFCDMAGVRMVHVPYKATSMRNSDLASGQIQVVFGNDLLPLAKAGKVRILAVTSAQRMASLPDMPAVAELDGMAGYSADVWYGLVAPAGVPPGTIDTLSHAIHKVLRDQRLQEQVMTSLGGIVAGTTPEAFAELIRSDAVKWGKVIKRTNIQISD